MTDNQQPSADDRMREDVFALLCQKYVQRAHARQSEMGLQYTTAETHDLADTVARFITHALADLPAGNGEGPLTGEMLGRAFAKTDAPDFPEDEKDYATAPPEVKAHFERAAALLNAKLSASNSVGGTESKASAASGREGLTPNERGVLIVLSGRSNGALFCGQEMCTAVRSLARRGMVSAPREAGFDLHTRITSSGLATLAASRGEA